MIVTNLLPFGFFTVIFPRRVWFVTGSTVFLSGKQNSLTCASIMYG